ncbi:hypothetical protein NPIL_394941 [Nephila pilipes]|uniref:Uncharacterized protein n=1 Tax=Nephila pilipes TaxID=299642 RepID=A0A8X6NBL6_NEPPI|nr:hypothetical protein NPIL_394941 [Nephila pilipes]
MLSASQASVSNYLNYPIASLPEANLVYSLSTRAIACDQQNTARVPSQVIPVTISDPRQSENGPMRQLSIPFAVQDRFPQQEINCFLATLRKDLGSESSYSLIAAPGNSPHPILYSDLWNFSGDPSKCDESLHGLVLFRPHGLQNTLVLFSSCKFSL